jgi:hypothetical protein
MVEWRECLPTYYFMVHAHDDTDDDDDDDTLIFYSIDIHSSKVAFFLLPLYPLAIGGPREYILFPPTHLIHSRTALFGRFIARGGG